MTHSSSVSASSVVAKNISISLAGRQVLQGITLSLAAGNTVAVIGPNGSGKSTLLRTLAGLLEPIDGRVLLDAEPITNLSRRALSKKIAYMPQRPETHFPLTCLEAVLLGRSPHKTGLGLADKTDLDLAESAMRRLEVWGLAERPITAVSGGELQRLMFARVIVQDSSFVLLDEPTSAQDPRGQGIVCTMIEELADSGVGVLAAIHDINLSLGVFARLAVLKNGRILQQGSPQDILDDNTLQRAFDVPFRTIKDGERAFVCVAPD